MKSEYADLQQYLTYVTEENITGPDDIKEEIKTIANLANISIG